MVLQALNRYYDILSSDPESGIAPPGYGLSNVSFVVVLSAQGDIVNLVHLVQKIERGNNILEIPVKMVVPEPKKRSGSAPPPNFMCDTAAYVLGISIKAEEKPDYAKKRFEAFCQYNRNILEQADCPEARAVISFLSTYQPGYVQRYPPIASNMEELLKATGNLVFKLEGSSKYAHEAVEIQRAWEKNRQKTDSVVGQCLVTGETMPIARLHPSLKQIPGANSSGASLVSFNDQAYESYNRNGGQGLNAPVCEKAAFAYTTALNFLLSRDNPNPKFSIGDTTVVYWADSPNPQYARRFANLVEMDEEDDESAELETQLPLFNFHDVKAERRMSEVADRVKLAHPMDVTKIMEGLDPHTQFYVLGIAPNAARISVRFFVSDIFGKIIERILQHYKDLEIEREYTDQPVFIPLNRLLAETVSKYASDPKASPLMAGAVMRSIFTGGPYPAALYNALITRIRADSDNKEKRITKVNYFRAAAIKACLTRKTRKYEQSKIQEVLQMTLNEQATHPAYLLGRLFAVLEKAQQKAIGDANATIKDRYFTSACASPATVFPVLLRLSQHHISKSDWTYGDRLIGQIMEHLDIVNNPIPARLSLDDQGVFVLGYYHQRNDFYKSKNNGNNATEADKPIE